jgi:hypothetical protein
VLEVMAGDDLSDALGVDRGARAGRVRQDDGEIVPAIARHDRELARVLPEQEADLAEHGV